MLPLCMEPIHRIRGIVGDLQLASLVIVTVPPVQNSIVVPLLVFELSVVPANQWLSQECQQWSYMHYMCCEVFQEDSPYSGVISILVSIWSTLSMYLEG